VEAADIDIREHFFGLLRTALNEVMAGGGRPYAAALKPLLKRLSNDGFSESRLGFDSFREFLRAAESRGLVELRHTAGGDIEVLPASNQPTPVGAKVVAKPEHVIRADLWRAFVDWSPELARVYDRIEDRAVTFPEEEKPFENERHTELRRAVVQQPARYVRITPISMDETLAVMRAFAETLADPDERGELQAALTRARPAAAFAAVVRSRPDLARGWHLVRLQDVADRISEWAARHDIAVDFIRTSQQVSSSGDAGLRAEDGIVAGRSAEALRAAILGAVERMPLSELLKLPIPVEYLINR
jgi:Uncharacterised protein family (UPF0158)